jgi:hypothetical protein
MIAAADCRDGHVRFSGSADGLLHGERRADLAHAVSGVDYQSSGPIVNDSRPALRIDATAAQFGNVFRDAQNTMAMNAAQIGGDQAVRQQFGVMARHVTRRENAGDQAAQFVHVESLFIACLRVTGQRIAFLYQWASAAST